MFQGPVVQTRLYSTIVLIARWVYPVISLGSQKQLQVADVYDIMPKFKTDILVHKFIR